jgi:putative secretion ATPase (PEP-CTERM system associated)
MGWGVDDVNTMYASFYKLQGLPFQLNPDHRYFFDGGPHKKALAHLKFGISQGEGFVVITGEIGAGKTTLLNYVLSQIQAPDRVTAKVVTTQLEAENFLRMAASAFGLPHVGADKATVLNQFESFLLNTHRAGKRALLFIDEVQNLPLASLEELRMLSNFQLDGKSLLQIYLIGQPQFKRTLSRHDLEQLRQRVITTYHLRSLDPRETRAYIEHRLRQVDWQNDPGFSEHSFERIFETTGGVPRKINLLCSRLLLFGFLEELHLIDRAMVDEVVSDMYAEGLWAIGANGLEADAGSGPKEAAAGLAADDPSHVLALGLLKLSRRLKKIQLKVEVQDKILSGIGSRINRR